MKLLKNVYTDLFVCISELQQFQNNKSGANCVHIYYIQNSQLIKLF